MAVAPVSEPRGLKRICPSCGTRYYDLNKRPPACPSCATEFKTEIKAKGRRGRLAAANDEMEKLKALAAKKAAAAAAEEAEAVVPGEEEIVSLTEVEDLEEADADEEDIDSDLPEGEDLEVLDEEDDDAEKEIEKDIVEEDDKG
jgi:uncharacterized protein (TIGR02300 family)